MKKTYEMLEIVELGPAAGLTRGTYGCVVVVVGCDRLFDPNPF